LSDRAEKAERGMAADSARISATDHATPNRGETEGHHNYVRPRLIIGLSRMKSSGNTIF